MQGILGSKMAMEKDKLLDWISKLVARKKVGALLLSVVFLAMFIFALLVRKEGVTANNMALSSPQSSQTFGEQTKNTASSPNILGVNPNMVLPPPLIAAVSLGYTLSPDHPGSNFTLPIPQFDKKKFNRLLPVCYLPVEKAIAMMPKVPSHSSVLKKLTYIYEQNLSRKTEFGGSDFGGYPTLKQRVDSYDIKESISVHCGFVIGVKPGTNTGFDIEDDDLRDMEQCGGVVVASAIFGNFEEINQPRYISEYSMKTVCFYMFVDEETEAYMKASVALGSSKKNGLWRIVVVHNLPYEDPWRNGRIPKLLLHRIFPNARFSLWIDGKLQLIRDPYQILERFLWRTNATFAISRHYECFDVYVEGEANKAAKKYNKALINFQIEFYIREGLTPYTLEKIPITSDVPEACVIIKEHIRISNLITCLWYNEVDRFTPRDQLSFSIVRNKIREKTEYTINMFLDCERRNFVVQVDILCYAEFFLYIQNHFQLKRSEILSCIILVLYLSRCAFFR
nr:probable hexosyltransferase MUCI70 [Ziziphus jujuba var. spinosa]